MLLPSQKTIGQIQPPLQFKYSQHSHYELKHNDLKNDLKLSKSTAKTQLFRAAAAPAGNKNLLRNDLFRELRSSRTIRSLSTGSRLLKASVQPQQVRGTLKRTDRLLRSTGSYMDEYGLRIAPGKHQVEIKLTSNRFLPRVQLLDSRTGRVIDRSAGKPARLSVTVQNAGLYRLRVLSDRPRQVGGYRLRYQVTPVPGVRQISQTPTPKFNSVSGYGLVNAAAAVARAANRASFPDVAFNEGITGAGQAYFWGLNRTNVPEVWAQGYRGQGVTIAVVDDGINPNHPALQNTLWTNAGEVSGNGIDDDRNGFADDVQGWNFVDNNSSVQPTGSSGSHGTFIAGVIAGQPASGNAAQVPSGARQRILGVAPDAKLMAIKVMSTGSLGRIDRVAQGIHYAVNNGAKIVNLSLGFADGASPASSPDSVLEAALQYARQRGVLVVMAAGNERQQGAVRPSEPAFGAVRDLGIAVGAIERSGALSGFSNPAGNQAIDYVTAPGTEIFSTFSSSRQQSYSFSSGTSFSAPHVAGIAALMLSANPALAPAQIEAILTQTAR